MLKKIASLVISAAIICGSFSINSVFAETISSKENTTNKTTAFPGAEGGGMYTAGARGAIENGEKMEVYHVTTLADSGEGSFRDAVSKGNRIIVFDVSGYIDLASNVNVGGKGGNLTILGQTAPGDGICFRGNNIKVSGENIILRYLRFRVGDKKLPLILEDGKTNWTATQDGLEIVDDTKNVILDHCSISWGTDENLSAYAVKDVTIQNCIIAEALNQSIHDKGEHSYAAIWGGVNLSVHHNLIATHKSRNPKIGTSETTAMTEGYKDADTLVDIRNNIFYNWGDKAGYGAENGAVVNIINNYYKSGPATPDDENSAEKNKRARIFEYSAGQKYQKNWSGKVYANGNFIYTDDTDSDAAKQAAAAVNANNYQAATGVYPDPKFNDTDNKLIYENLENPKLDYYNDYPITTTDAAVAYDYVLKNAGARLPKMDKVDERIINNVKERTAPNGSKGSVGLVDSPADTVPKNDKESYDDRGYPLFNDVNNDKKAQDTDNDGIPDTWEEKMGLDKDNANDSLNIGPDGYTWLEIYSEDIIKGNTDGTINLGIDKETYSQTESIALNIEDSNENTYKIYCDDKEITESDSKEITLKNLPLGENYITVKAINSDGSYSFSNTKVIYIYGDKSSGNFDDMTTEGAVVSEKDGSFYMYTNGNAKAAIQKKDITGDFTFSTNIDYVSNLIDYVQTGISITSEDNCIKLYKTYRDHKPLWILETKTESSAVSNIDTYKDNLIRIDRNNGKFTLKAGNSAASLKEIFSSETDFSENITVEVYTLGVAEKYTSSEFGNITYIPSSEVTHPEISMNIKDNQKLEFRETIIAEVTPNGAEINEIAVFFKNNIIKDVFYNPGINEKQTVEIPINFLNADKGELRVICFDKNLGMAETKAAIVVSADITPWTTTNIGGNENDMPSYVQGTNDYTYKLYGPEGNISGNSDKYGYMYQQCDDNMRMYFRIRPQQSKNAGIMFKNSLDADGVSYFFGIEPNETAKRGYIYVLKAREAKGEDYKTIASLDYMEDDKYFIIIEKIGDKIKIYQTAGDNSANHYKTKNLLAETTVSLGDTYYMGFAATKGGADIGWTAIESIDSSNPYSYLWNMNYGLDWWWQYPKDNSLYPLWTNDSVGGNSTGKMLVQTNSDYTVQGNIAREFKIENGKIESGFDIFVTGEKPSVNLYLQTESNQAYNVGFNSDNTVNICDNIIKNGESDYEYSTSEWYKVKINSEVGSGKADFSLYDSQDNIISEIKDVSAKPFTNIKTTYNSKNVAITQGFIITPSAKSQGTYYIDNMYVSADIRSKLENAVKNAEKFDGKESEYGPVSYAAFQEALKNAKSVLENQNASSSEILEALENLEKAVNKLMPLSIEIKGETKFWNFGNKEFIDFAAEQNNIIKKGTYNFDELTLDLTSIDDSKANFESSKKSADDGTALTHGLKAGTQHFKVAVSGKCDITVYAVTASSKEDRNLVITDGSNPQKYLLLKTNSNVSSNTYSYNGTEPAVIDIYGESDLNYYGIKYTPYGYIDNTKPRIIGYDKNTGFAEIHNGISGIEKAAVGIIVTDADGKLLEIKKAEISQAKAEENIKVKLGKVSANGITKVILWDNIDNMKPICESLEIK